MLNALREVDHYDPHGGIVPEQASLFDEAVPERLLVAARVRDCLDALTGAAKVAATDDEVDDLLDWLADDSAEAWSVSWCCDVLGLSVAKLRAGIAKLRAEWIAEREGTLL